MEESYGEVIVITIKEYRVRVTRYRHQSREGHQPFFRVTVGAEDDSHELEFEVPTRGDILRRIREHLTVKGERYQGRQPDNSSVANEVFRVIAVQEAPEGEPLEPGKFSKLQEPLTAAKDAVDTVLAEGGYDNARAAEGCLEALLRILEPLVYPNGKKKHRNSAGTVRGQPKQRAPRGHYGTQS